MEPTLANLLSSVNILLGTLEVTLDVVDWGKVREVADFDELNLILWVTQLFITLSPILIEVCDGFFHPADRIIKVAKSQGKSWLNLLAVADLQTVLTMQKAVVVHGLQVVITSLLSIIIRDGADE